ncbi:excinuclease ABC subunit C [bacterium DOLZORAL124_38_8]|nr:MAG: excinuclease ABC subunit C [bacterium DOLZORAL124_38_8]
MTKPSPFVLDSTLIPTNPGCYLFKDKNDKIIYIGKAKNLRKRVKSYFLKNNKSPKTASLVKHIQSVETRIVGSETEALILENTLIKKHQPKYNILLRDDKNFLYLRITKEDLPKMEITRRLINDGSTYIGPRTSAKSFRNTIAFCQKFFGAKMVDAKKDNYVAKMLQKTLSDDEYKTNIKRMIRFLRGDNQDVIKELQTQMMQFAQDRNFEAAAKTRDLITSIQGSTQKQIIEFEQTVSRDVIGLVRQHNTAYFVRMMFRNGKFVDQSEIKISAPEFEEDSVVLGQFLQQFYTYVDSFPKEILLPFVPNSDTELNEFLSATKNNSINIKQEVPYQGDKLKVVELAQKNAENFAKKSAITKLTQNENFTKALPQLAEKLNLKAINRMECYDISHFAGQQTVASQIVFLNGKPAKNEYRRYKIQTLKPGEIDDFQSMREVLGRRFSAFKNKPTSEQKDTTTFKTPTTKAEKQALLEFGDKIFSQELGWPSMTNFEEENFDEEKYKFLAAYNKKGEIMGRIKLKIFPPQMAEIEGIVVKKNQRGKGLGTQLIQKISQKVLEDGIKKLFVVPDVSAEIFYTKLGFKVNQKPLKKIQKYIKEMSETYPETNTIWKSYEWKIKLPPKEISKNPDLIVIDGGKGQLSAVLETLKEYQNLPLDISTQIIALAKQEEEVFRGKFINGELQFEQINIPNTSAASLLLQRIRDEAHRFAISFNRNLRAKKMVKSALDEVPGIGGVTKKKLLQTIGSVSAIQNADDETLLKIVNRKQLDSLRKNL